MKDKILKGWNDVPFDDDAYDILKKVDTSHRDRREMGRTSTYLVVSRPVYQALRYAFNWACGKGDDFEIYDELTKYDGLELVVLDDDEIYWRIG